MSNTIHWFIGKEDSTYDATFANQHSASGSGQVLAENDSARITIAASRLAYIRRGGVNRPILATGLNAIADANGFWKTASPVIKLFADGTSELTTELLSEGVYRISGCLGLNAARLGR